MTSHAEAPKSPVNAHIGVERVESVLIPITSRLKGSKTPRIATKPLKLPSKGDEVVEFAKSIGLELMDWQAHLAGEMFKYQKDGRWAHNTSGFICARQQGKTTFMAAVILTGLFKWNLKLQIGTSHRLTTSFETFRQLVGIIEDNEQLLDQVKKIRWRHGSEEIELKNGCRYMVRAGASAARGIAAPDLVWIDEARELKDLDTWASMRYTTMSNPNPMIITLSNAGDQHSLVLNQLRDRALKAIAGAKDSIGWWEWSSGYDQIDDSKEFWKGVAQANPSLGKTVHPDNIRDAMNDDPSVFKTEVLCQWVTNLSAAIPPEKWIACGEDDLTLSEDEPTWFGIDLSPDRKYASLVAAQKMSDDRFYVKLLHSWHNPISVDDLAIANDLAPYVRKYPCEVVAYSKRTASAVAARLVPAGIPIQDIDGNAYSQACDELLGAVTSKRLRHSNQEDFTQGVNSAARLVIGDGGWVIGRRASGVNVTSAVAAALATHFATRPNHGLEILVV
nr:MAG: terminase large subunit [Caudoviricetes sp.]